MIELIEKLLPLEVALGTGGALTYLMHKYDIENIYQNKVVPLISDACYPYSKERLKKDPTQIA